VLLDWQWSQVYSYVSFRSCKIIQNQTGTKARTTDWIRRTPILTESQLVSRCRLWYWNFWIRRVEIFPVAGWRKAHRRRAIGIRRAAARWWAVENARLAPVKPPMMWDLGWCLARWSWNWLSSSLRLWHCIRAGFELHPSWVLRQSLMPNSVPF
jgi:hypothetical protein